ncbi:hypothetical protein DSO57_1005098 [Entomophthora muscae]|uniref:Uncharacterized protein n=1 Tax=Entomophthora muscae TaxID=34485 RepID=A0ACC2SA30_9FUNG|nr:hypothetical protein DSO57_1005098 [Entomophthora muscae]
MFQEAIDENPAGVIATLDKAAVPTLSHGVRDELIAGTFAGWAQVVVGHPFDTVKVKLQTQTSPLIYSGPMDCVRKLIKADGIGLVINVSGLFRGVTSPLVGVGACNAVIFSSNGFFKRQIAEIFQKTKPRAP